MLTTGYRGLMPSRTPKTRRVVIAVLAALVLVVTAFLAWASSPMTAEAGPLARTEAASTYLFTETVDGVVLHPVSPNGTGLVYLAGARVEPAAYANKLSGLAEAGITVVIARPTLNFAIFETRPLAEFEALAPGVSRWFVGGHSLGGVRACQYAADPLAADSEVDAVAGLILFGSYCAADLSASGLPVLSIAGEFDGLSTPAKIEAAADLLPADTRFDTIPGAVHGQFGDYGVQPGDGSPTTTDAQVRAAITADVLPFVAAG